MKKLTSRRKRWLSKRQRAMARHHFRRKPISASRKWHGAQWKPVSIHRPSQKARIGLGVAIPMPAVMCFDKNPEATLESLDRIRSILHQETMQHRKAGARQKNTSKVNYSAFENIRQISPSAALVMAAEYERTYYLNKSEATIINLDKWDPAVRGTLGALGFFEKFGFPGTFEQPFATDRFRILPMRSGSSADPLEIKALIRDLKDLYPLQDEDRTAGLVHLFGAMVEAMVNVVRHAYPADGKFPYEPINRWWMTGAVDQDARWTTAMVFDQGVTIPVSLPNWQHYAGVLRRIASWTGLAPAAGDPRSDGLAISAAVEESVTSTGESHRGRGLAQMRDFVDQCRGGYLRIMSRFGEVKLRPGQKPDVRSYETSAGGTLIEWNVVL